MIAHVPAAMRTATASPLTVSLIRPALRLVCHQHSDLSGGFDLDRR